MLFQVQNQLDLIFSYQKMSNNELAAQLIFYHPFLNE